MSLVPQADEPRLKDLSPEYAEIMVLGKVFQASGYFKDVRDQAQAVTKILYGRELGISPINSMSGIHIVEGKPTLSSNLMAALIKRSGKYDYRVKVWTDDVCTLTFRQKAGDAWEEVGDSSFTMEDARRAGVIRQGSGWTKYPKAMLFARALSQGERTYCPDVSMCALYVPEELGAEVNESGEVVALPSKPDVPRTTEPIPVSGPAVSATADNVPTIKGNAVPPKAAKAQEAVSGPPLLRQPGEDFDPDEPIDLPRQKALHRAFRDAIKNPDAQKQSDIWLREWLTKQGYIGEDGRGSTKVIPLLLFDEVKTAAVKFASSLPA